MHAVATDSEFKGRPHLRRTLDCAPFVHFLFHGYRSVAFLCVIVGLVEAGLAVHFGKYTLAVSVATEFSLILGLFFYLAHSTFKPLLQTHVHLHEDGLRLEVQGHFTELSFIDIKRVNFFHLPYLGGHFILLMNSGKAYKFSMLLQRSEYLLESIFIARPGLIEPGFFRSYRRTAIITDHASSRLFDGARNIRSFLMTYLFYPVCLTTAAVLIICKYNGVQLSDRAHQLGLLLSLAALGFLVLNMAIKYFIWLGSEANNIIAERQDLLDNELSVRRDFKRELRIKRRWSYVHIGGSLAFVTCVIAYLMVAT